MHSFVDHQIKFVSTSFFDFGDRVLHCTRAMQRGYRVRAMSRNVDSALALFGAEIPKELEVVPATNDIYHATSQATERSVMFSLGSGSGIHNKRRSQCMKFAQAS